MMQLRHSLQWLLSASTAAAISFAHRESPPPGWEPVTLPVAKVASSPAPQVFTIALAMQNIETLESMLLAISTPGHAQYGKYLDHEQISAHFAPSSAAVDSVTAWLKSGNITQYTVNGAFVDFAADIPTANKLLKASYQHYSHNGVTKLRTLSYSIPDRLDEHITLITPGTYFDTVRSAVPTPSRARGAPEEVAARGASTVSVDASCQTSVTPACLKQMYNVGDYTPDPKSGSVIGFGSFLNESALYSDLFQYEDMNGIPRQNFSVELIAGGTNNQDPSTAQYGEANMDVQIMVGVAHPLPVVEYITGGSPPFIPNIDQPTPADNQNEPYVPYYRYLLSKPNSELPQVISNSYGDEEDSVPFNYAVLTCNLIGLMGLRGITILESSGDLGVGSGCLAPDNKTVEFNAIFPATCPYVTSVGGTVNATPEVAWKGSSGGFSKYFGRALYQSAAVGSYLQRHVSPSTRAYYGRYTNFAGRGFPDVAAHSAAPAYRVVNAGKAGHAGGTSAASPLWAAVVGLLNDARLRAGRPALGFLNPLLYALGPRALVDVTAGYAVGCDGGNTQTGRPEPPGSGIVPGARWNATEGWDPVTGLGLPDFQRMKDLVLSF